ncbi:GntR family transcriptional regulator [Roseivivax halodurans JCM 10272]|uniref:GntR family transcriptional regulator n=1 Tax=Roseivivax halodurans JCM 10272 TaxID=1449350 RepID=X7EGV5_9RHOB|nr:FadR/GntR family transcriptional regulator [Roseivivax halodurans]ETX14416.1 GntR family transcriptional regulator [Roseivivax halodurans JCM 10272]
MSPYPDEKQPVTLVASQRLQDMIRSGAFPQDSKLPSQRVLAEQLGVSRASLREALLTLETLGLVRTLPARGTFVTGKNTRPEASQWRHESTYSMQEVFQTRIMIEGEICRLAAPTVTDGALARIGKAAEVFESAWSSGDLVGHVEADLEFHQLIAQACPNALLQEMYRSVHALITESQRVPIPITAVVRMQDSIAEHRAILEGLRLRDPSAARAAMERHIRNTSRCAGIAAS